MYFGKWQGSAAYYVLLLTEICAFSNQFQFSKTLLYTISESHLIFFNTYLTKLRYILLPRCTSRYENMVIFHILIA